MKHLNFSWPLLLAILLALPLGLRADDLPALHVDGRYFKDNNGNIVNLHGFAQTYSPWFNEQGTKWTNYDIDGCLSYNQGLIDDIVNGGWKMNMLRLHMDPYWSNDPNITTTGENDISAFNMTRFKTYFRRVFMPMAKYAISKGMYVIMRPPGVCPEKIQVGDEYQAYLKQVWGYVAQQTWIKNNPNVIFELANEPVNVYYADGTQATAANDSALTQYFQAVVDTIRCYTSTICLIPGWGYQSKFECLANNPVKGENIGYAIHCYPGWYNSGSEETPTVDYASFKSGWDEQIKPITDIAPCVVTEMDWAPAKYNSSWGKGITGVAGGTGFGANFKKLCDDSGNVSWLFFTGANLIAQYDDTAADDTTKFLTDPRACVRPCYRWYQDYDTVNYAHSDFESLSTAVNEKRHTFINPVIQADFPDPEVIRVGDVYYMVTTTMHNFPGCTLLKSYDLINWEYCANPLASISNLPYYNLEDGKNIYAAGAWANAMCYRNGKFYIMFNCFGKGSDDGGGYLLSATDPEGKWTMTHLPRGFYDPGFFQDDDGTLYCVYGNKDIYVGKLDDNFNLVEEHKVISKEGLEGNHMFKKDGYYYIYSTCAAWPATQWCYRSTSIFGTYEEKKVFDQNAIHQGQIIQTQTGEWWTMLMKDNGALGRMPWLEPVTWTDNWPVIGDNGTAHTDYQDAPNVGRIYRTTYLPTNDAFANYKLGMQWQWNHNADASKYSLIERSGFLRLYTATVTDSLLKARNTLTQRIFGYHNDSNLSLGTVAMDVSNMADGDFAGLCILQKPYGIIGVRKSGSTYQIVQTNSDATAENTVTITPGDLVYLRATVNTSTNTVTFSYSTDNSTYTDLGSTLTMQYDMTIFVGNRFGIFNYATQALGGYVDVDWFSTDADFNEADHYDLSQSNYSEESLTATSIALDETDYDVLMGGSQSIVLTATFSDGHTEDVTTAAKYTIADESIVSLSSGRLDGLKEGSTPVTVTYTDPLGNELTLNFTVTVEVFPLKEGAVTTTIWGTNSFTEEKGAMTISQYGFVGWKYDNGIDLSPYKYIIIQLYNPQSLGAQFRLYDENNYWTACSESTINSSNLKTRITLNGLKDSEGNTVDLSHIYIAGFWVGTAGTLNVKKVFLSNNGSTAAGIDGVLYDGDEANVLSDVYTLSGICLYRDVKWSDVKDRLPKGIYIFNQKKVVVQ
jgi:beta-xylosidase